MGAHVILEVPAPLKKLLSQIPGAQVVLAFGEPLPPFDYYCPIMSLPRAFKTRLDTIPASIPYLRAPADRVAHWETRLPKANCLRIGLVWSVSSASKVSDGYNKWLSFNQLDPLVSVDGISFVSLHRERDLSSEDASAVANCVRVVDFGHEQPDFVDTAAIISSLDLVISVDTALGHLAGALGVPVWIMLKFSPDWRWLLGRSDSPWYPNARLFRQPRLGDWDSVIAEVAQEVVRLRDARSTP
jgi:Glycosyltransferase family 9 (heptosyltransferase)